MFSLRNKKIISELSSIPPLIWSTEGCPYILTPKAPNKTAADDILIFYFYLSKKIRLDFFM